MAELGRRRLGRTGLMVTELGLGAMDTPTAREGTADARARARPSGSTSSTRRASTRAASS